MGLLYSKMKVFHFKDKLDSLPLSVNKILSPIQIRIKPTNICNHNCWYCAYKMDNLQLGKNMVARDFIPKEKMMEIIEDITEMGVKSVIFSGGGEPLLYPHIIETVKKLADSKVKFASLTNGAKLSGEIAEIFAQKGTWIRISIEGWDEESYAKYRKVPKNEFTKVMKNIANFKKINGKCHLGVSIIVDKSNSSHIYSLIKGLKESGVNSVKVSPCFISDIGKENNEYHKPIFSKIKEAVGEAIADFKDNNFEIYDSYHKQLETFDKEYTWCPFIQLHPVIGADLNVYSCQDKAYNLDSGLLGTIINNRFKDFWFSDKSNFFKINPMVHCRHHCVVNERNKLVLEYLNSDKEHLEFI